MRFYEVLDQMVQLLRQGGRVSYRALKREFQLDDAFLEDLKDEIIKAQLGSRPPSAPRGGAGRMFSANWPTIGIYLDLRSGLAY
jgi:hypothetical protein